MQRSTETKGLARRGNIIADPTNSEAPDEGNGVHGEWSVQKVQDDYMLSKAWWIRPNTSKFWSQERSLSWGVGFRMKNLFSCMCNRSKIVKKYLLKKNVTVYTTSRVIRLIYEPNIKNVGYYETKTRVWNNHIETRTYLENSPSLVPSSSDFRNASEGDGEHAPTNESGHWFKWRTHKVLNCAYHFLDVLKSTLFILCILCINMFV